MDNLERGDRVITPMKNEAMVVGRSFVRPNQVVVEFCDGTYQRFHDENLVKVEKSEEGN